MQGIIVENKSNTYCIKSNNEIYEAVARGRLKNENLNPVVGDKVQFEILNEEKKEAVIEKIEERTVYIKRPKMSNITKIILVVSCKHPKPDLLLLDKQLIFAEWLKIKPVIVLNKIDLDSKNDYEEIENIYSDLGYKVITTNAKGNIGIDKLLEELKGEISAFSGNSGVGKSTLINAIFNDLVTIEGEISKKNKRGKNTTTGTKLYEINENTFIADTPGFSTFDIYEIDYRELYKYFIEFNKYVENCEYIGCSHVGERKCGIKDALESNEINKSRYDNYVKIYQELKKKEDNKYK
mgnify:FL=1